MHPFADKMAEAYVGQGDVMAVRMLADYLEMDCPDAASVRAGEALRVRLVDSYVGDGHDPVAAGRELFTLRNAPQEPDGECPFYLVRHGQVGEWGYGRVLLGGDLRGRAAELIRLLELKALREFRPPYKDEPEGEVHGPFWLPSQREWGVGREIPVALAEARALWLECVDLEHCMALARSFCYRKEVPPSLGDIFRRQRRQLLRDVLILYPG